MEKKPRKKKPRKRDGFKGVTVFIRKEAVPMRVILKELALVKIH